MRNKEGEVVDIWNPIVKEIVDNKLFQQLEKAIENTWYAEMNEKVSQNKQIAKETVKEMAGRNKMNAYFILNDDSRKVDTHNWHLQNVYTEISKTLLNSIDRKDLYPPSGAICWCGIEKSKEQLVRVLDVKENDITVQSVTYRSVYVTSIHSLIKRHQLVKQMNLYEMLG